MFASIEEYVGILEKGMQEQFDNHQHSLERDKGMRKKFMITLP